MLLVFSLAVLLAVPAFASSATVDVERGSYRGDSDTWYYTPEEVRVSPGGTVTFRNPRSHGLLGSADDHPTSCVRETRRGRTKGDCPFSTFQLPPGASHTVTFPEAGTFQYVCALHAWMVGTVVVGSGEPPAPEPEPTRAPAPEPEPEPSPTPERQEETRTEPAPAADPSPTQEPAEEPARDDEPQEADDDAEAEVDEVAEDEVAEDEVAEAEDPEDEPGTDLETHATDTETEQVDAMVLGSSDGARDRPGLVAFAVALLALAAGSLAKVRSTDA